MYFGGTVDKADFLSLVVHKSTSQLGNITANKDKTHLFLQSPGLKTLLPLNH